jgi:hypothetical protein
MHSLESFNSFPGNKFSSDFPSKLKPIFAETLQIANKISLYLSAKLSAVSSKLDFVWYYACYRPPIVGGLCSFRNMTTKDVILSGENERATKKFIHVSKELLTDPMVCSGLGITLYEREFIQQINACSLPQDPTSGICLGASIIAAKKVMQKEIQTEKELIAVLSAYKDGFPVEAYALQNTYKVFSHAYNALNLRSNVDVDNANHSVEKSGEAQAITIAAMLGSVDVEFDRTLDKTHMTKEGESYFNQLENGHYIIAFFGHAIYYLRTDFGSYFIDPNSGLLSCFNQSPVDALKKIRKIYAEYLGQDEEVPFTVMRVKNRKSQVEPNIENNSRQYSYSVFWRVISASMRILAFAKSIIKPFS